MIEYKGYAGQIEYDDEAGIFHGEIANVRPVITFGGTSVDELRREMAASVDDYLNWCQERGKEPEQPYTGTLLVRGTPDLHRAVAIAASRANQSMNAWATEALGKAAGVLT